MVIISIISLTTGIVSIILGGFSIYQSIQAKKFSENEARKSEDSYQKTKDLLTQIEHKAELIDRTIQFQQKFLFEIMNKILDKANMESVHIEPISMKEIDSLFSEQTSEVSQRIAEIEKAVDRLPKIHVGPEPPKESKDGDFWFQTQ